MKRYGEDMSGRMEQRDREALCTLCDARNTLRRVVCDVFSWHALCLRCPVVSQGLRVGAGGDGARESQAHPRHLHRTGTDVVCGAACVLAKRCLVLTCRMALAAYAHALDERFPALT
eukprot:3228597-Rhodomonas_salina.1